MSTKFNSRAKGKRGERELSKLVVAYFVDFGITCADIYSTPLSGGHRFAKKTDGGDLVISDNLRQYFNFSVEAKNYAAINWLLPMLAYRSKSDLSKWWKQCITASDAAKPYQPPLLVVKARGTPYIAFVRRKNIPKLGTRSEFYRLRPFTITKCVGEEVVMLPLSSLLSRMVQVAESNKGRK